MAKKIKDTSYIQFDNNTYFKTTYQPTSSVSCSYEIKLVPNSNAGACPYFGSRQTWGTGTIPSHTYELCNDGTNFQHRFGSVSSDSYGRYYMGTVQLDSIYEVSGSPSTVSVSIDSGTVTTYSPNGTFSGCVCPIYIGWLNTYNQGGSDEKMQGKIYYLRFYENDVLVHNFQPYIDDSGVYCLRDDVTNDILYSQGTSTVTGFVEYEEEGVPSGDTTVIYFDNQELIPMYYKGNLLNTLYHNNSLIFGKEKDISDKVYYVGGEDDTNNHLYYTFDYYWGEGYTMQVDMFMQSSRTTGDRSIIQIHQRNASTPTAPIEFNSYSNGFYYDYHAPQSTTSNSCYSGDYTYRQMNTSISSIFKKDETRMLVDLTVQTVKIYDKASSSLLGSYGTTRSGYSWYNGLYVGAVVITPYCFVHSVKITDASGNVVNNLIFKKRDSTGTDMFYLYDTITDSTYENSSTTTPIYVIDE